ncbi:PstS family phosphate ABC transporter substrate-binding protein [Chloroflexota bacterium]
MEFILLYLSRKTVLILLHSLPDKVNVDIIALMKIIYLIIIISITIMLGACAIESLSEGTVPSSKEKRTVENKGSDTMVNLALAWAEEYQKTKPDVIISVTGGGSGTGIAALINGTVDIANASRQMKDVEYENALSNGKNPNEIIVARDAIAVIVNPNNPIDSLTLKQISDIYSGKISNWMEIGGEDRPIVRLSRETNSGTHVYFLEEVLRLGEKEVKTLFSQDTLLLPSSEGISSEIRINPNAIGYDGLGYVTPDLKVIAIAKNEDAHYVLPSAETVNNNSYPIARDLYMYIDGEPTSVVEEYLAWIFGPEAQRIVTDLGFVPIQNP